MLTKTTYQGSTTSYTYDGAGVLVDIFNPDYLTVNYQYDNAGRLLSRVMSSGARSMYAYDNGGWLQSLNHYDATGTLVTSESYTRDRVGNITGLNVATGPKVGATSYTLDALYRLTVVNAPAAVNSEAFSYDHIGNRLTATRGGTTVGAVGSTTKYYLYTQATKTGAVTGYTPSYDNRLASIHIGGTTGALDSGYTFDNEGRLTAQSGSNTRTMTWDAKGRMHTLNAESYLYDPMDYRIGRSGGTLGSLNYYLEGEHLESVEQASSNTLIEKYFRGSGTDELVAGYVSQNNTLTPYFFQHDSNMSVSAETDPNGGTQASMAYWSFGETQATSGTPVNRLQYTGRENDGTGLYYYRARYYDPVIGRFISEDPKGFAAGINFYAYVNNNPVNLNDPTGFGPETILKYVQMGIKIVNQYIETHPITGIPFKDGFPDFSGIATHTVQIEQTGKNAIDFARANEAAGLPQTPEGYTWHHVEDGTTMQLVPSDIHGATGHTGGAALARATAAVGGVAAAGDAQASDSGGVTWGDVGNFLMDFLVPGGVGNAGGAGDMMPISAPQQSIGPQTGGALGNWGISGGSWDSSAAGGFLLYPNKPNTNQMRSVYSK